MKKAFTLLELLAVMVIISLIFVITVVLAEKAIEKVRLSSIKESAKNYIREVEQKISKDYIKNGKVIKSGYFFINDSNKKEILQGEDSSITLDAKGDLPSKGTMCVNKDGKVIRYSLKFGKYVVSKITGDQEIEKTSELESIDCGYGSNTLTITVTGNSSCALKKEGWDQEKTITITPASSLPDSAKIQYSIDNKKGPYIDYTGPFTIQKNCTIYARLFSDDFESKWFTQTITTIDRTVPTITLIESCNNNTNINSHFNTVFGASGGTFSCNVNTVAVGSSSNLLCTATSGSCVTSEFSGTASGTQQSSVTTLSKNGGVSTDIDIDHIDSVKLYVQVIGGHDYSFGTGTSDEDCDKYGSASATLKLYGRMSDGTSVELSSAAASVASDSTTGCDCSANHPKCSGSASGKCKSKTVIYKVTDADRQKYTSLYLTRTSSSKDAPTSCSTVGQGHGHASPKITTNGTFYNIIDYCVTKN